MRRLGLALAVALLLGIGLSPMIPGSHGPQAPVHQTSIVSPLAFAQLTSTANENLKRTTVFHQNNSGTFGGSSTIASFPTNFTTTGSYTSVSSFQESFTVTTSNGYFPQVNITQGATVLANATVSLPFTLGPRFSSTAVQERVVETYSSQGAVPNNGAYTITSVASQAIIYALTTQVNWTQNASSYQLGYTVSAPKGYSLNSTQVFVPFPSQANVNYSTVAVTANGTTMHGFQVQTGGVYVNWAALGPGFNLSLNVKFQNLPTTVGVAPVLATNGYALLNQSYFQLNVSWSNLLSNTYAGVFLIVANFSGQLNPNTLTLINGNKVLSSGSYYLSGNTLTVLPNVVTVPVAGTVTFYLDFQFYGAPPRFLVNSATPCLPVGSVSISCGTLTGGGALLMPVVLLVGWFSDTKLSRSGDVGMFTQKAFRNNPRFTYSVLFVFLALLATWILLQVI